MTMENLGPLAKALAAAQLEMKDARKIATNPHFKSKYADLPAVREAVTSALAKHGLAVSQSFEPMGLDGVCVITLLMHESGGRIESKLFVPATKKDAQGFGSAITYGRRYGLAAICGIASDDDDDANVATGKAQEAKAEEKAASAVESAKAEEALANLFDLATNTAGLAAAEAAAAKAVQAGEVNEAGRNRLREKRAKAVARVSGQS